MMLNKDIDFQKINSINERIKTLRESIRVSRSYFEIKYKLSKETLKRWETSDCSLKKDALEKIVNIFKNEGIVVSKDWLETGKGDAPSLVPVQNKVYSKTRGNKFLIDPSEPEHIRSSKEIEFILNFYEDVIHLFITDETMLPLYPMDCCVIGRKKTPEDIINEAGKDCIVKIKEYDYPIFRRVIVEPENKVSLYIINCSEGISNAPPIISNVEVEYLARVKWIVR